MQMIIFTLNENYYAFSSENVEEITNKMPWTPVPQSPSWVQGLVNLRGNVITLINFYKLLSPTDEIEEICYNNIIIVKNDEEKIAFMVDEVAWVLDIEPSAIQQLDDKTDELVSSVIQVKDQIVSVINMEKLFL
ncbi:chemotaxis protein CheW [Carnobacterium inhibens]|uniref:Chemotaxis protein CheW n=2 Tax=Carnobacterium TaxID=2747 RepID=U5SER5_9LACT|nr:chemotaxis protein CheW [Carnobacterium inhibens]AGY82362.1 chemotaxis protein CheW [Carnobacterium inhibens subsp. gilichinskyi]